MKLKVKYMSILKGYIKKDSEVIEINTDEVSLNEFIKKIFTLYPGFKEIGEQVGFVVLVNDKVPKPNTKLKDGDEVFLIPIASGG